MASSKALVFSLFVLATSAIPQASSASSAAETVTATSTGTDSPFSFGSDITSTTAHPTGSVVSIPVPGGVDNNQTLVGSLIGTANSLTTIAVTCPDGTDQNDCGFDPPLTFTYGPSTVHINIAYDSSDAIDEACQYSSGGAVCTILESGDASLLATDTNIDASTLTGATTIASTTTLASDEIVMYPVTITAGLAAGQTIGVSSAASTTSGASSRSGSTSSRSGSNTGASAASTSAPNNARALAPGAAAAGLMGLAALML